MSFKQWALIADLYTPLLMAISLYIVFTHASTAQQRSTYHWQPIAISLIVVYVARLGDEVLNIWASFGADYSTHTAFALVLVLHQMLNSRWLKWLAPLSLLAYMQLMNHQNYHSYLDMVSTIIFLTPIFAVIWSKVNVKP